MKCSRNIAAACLFALIFCSGCTAPKTEIPTDPEARAAYYTQQRREDVYEGALRHLFVHNYSALQNNAKAYFILLDGTNPSEAFLRRFKDNDIPVKTRSRSSDGFLTEIVRDRDNLKNYGIIFMLERLTFGTDGTATVTVKHYESPTSKSEVSYTLRQRGSRWEVISEKPIRLM